MTWTICSDCNRYTFAYRDSCERCDAPLDGMRALYGAGGQDLPDFFCHACGYVNPEDLGSCRDCGKPLTQAQKRLSSETTWVAGLRKALAGIERVKLDDIVEDMRGRGRRPTDRTTLDSFLRRESFDPSHMKRTGNLSVAQSVDVAIALCEILAEIHSRNVVHRNVKPSHIVGNIPKTIVLDGFSNALVDGENGPRVSGYVGTFIYSAPEQFVLPGKVDRRADVYSLGLILYQLLCGSYPYAKVRSFGSPTEYLKMHEMSVPSDPHSLKVDLPSDVRDILLACVEKEPKKRPGSTMEIRDVLIEWRKSVGPSDAGQGDLMRRVLQNLKRENPLVLPPGYDFVEELGRGGLGVTVLAKSQENGELVAVQTLPDSNTTDDVKRMWKRSAELYASVSHPGIVRLREFLERDGRPYLVVEHIKGPSLQDLISKSGGNLALDVAVEICLDTLNAVAHLHSQGIVHRDIKPRHILLTSALPPWIPKLSLCRLSRKLFRHNDPDEFEKQGVAVGTLPFMPPEQILDSRSVGPPADVFAVGAMLYNVLTGKFIRDHKRDQNVMIRQVALDPAIPIQDRDPNIPPAIAEVINRALSMNPKERFQDGAELGDALRDAARQCRLAPFSSNGDTTQRPGRNGDTTETKGQTSKSEGADGEALDISVGDVLLDRYEVEQVLRSGSFTNVYQVKDRKDNALLALLVPTIHFNEDKERFSKQCEFMKALTPHPRIVKYVRDISIKGDPGRLFEYASSDSLWEWLEGDSPGARSGSRMKKRRDLSLEDKIRIAIHVCEGMQRIEECGFVHRDLKPTNILMFENGDAKVADLELLMHAGQPVTGADDSEIKTLVKPAWVDDATSKARDESLLETSRSGVVGTPAYMSPEQFDGSSHLDSRSDIYSLGVVLYQMFCGCRPFEAAEKYKHAVPAFRFAELERMHREQTPRDPRELFSNLPDPLASLILRCLEKDRERRPQSFSDVLQQLHVIRHTVQHLGESKKQQKVGSAKTTGRDKDEMLKLILDRLRKGKPSTPLLTIPGFEVIRELGRGGMCAIFEARKQDDGRVVALKVLIPDRPVGRGSRDIFLKEFEIAQRVKHRNVVECIAFSEGKHPPWFAMAMIPNWLDLGQHAKNRGGKVPLDEALGLALQILDGLAHLHRNGFVHRDIKPANIIVSTEQETLRPIITCLDMGTFYEGEMSGEMHEKPGSTIGTLPFMPPEQIVDSRSVRPTADLFATGATLYHILTGQFIRDFSRNQNVMIRQVMQDPPIPIRDRDSTVPPIVALIIDKALSLDPKERYQSAEEMRDAIKSAAEQCGFIFDTH